MDAIPTLGALALLAGGMWAIVERRNRNRIESAVGAIVNGSLDFLVRKVREILKGDMARNVVVLLGVGGAGKTTLIRYLTGDLRADPTQITNEFNIYSKTSRVRKTKPNGGVQEFETTIYITDYRGQDYNSLIIGLAGGKQGKLSAVRSGNINTLLFIVDVFPPPLDRSKELSTSNAADMNRIQEHIAIGAKRSSI
jgi:hypothetical protein